MLTKGGSLVSLYSGLPRTPVWDICTLRRRVTLLKSAFPSSHYEYDEYLAWLTSLMSGDSLDSL